MLEISTKERNQRLKADNTWWQDPDDVRWSGELKRVYFAPFYELIRKTGVNRAVVLMGPRRVGKTVMAHQAVARLIKEGVKPANILYIQLDNPLYAGLSLEKILQTFLKLNKIGRNETVYVFFDEIQYLKDWKIHLKSLVDSRPQHRFIATGSAAAALRLKSGESGAGRFTDFILPPLAFYEYMKFIGKDEILTDQYHGNPPNSGRAMEIIAEINRHFINYLNFGGYPESVFSEDIKEDPGRFIKSDIIDKVLLKDLPSLYGISDIPELNRLFMTIAHNTGGEVNLSGLSQDANVTKTTISKYLEYLEAAFLIKRVRRVDKNIKKFKRDHTFKVYLTNPSMYAALFGMMKEDNASALGRLAETAVFSHLFHLIREPDAPCYARWNGGEVDMVLMDETGTKAAHALEIKWSDTPYKNPSRIKGLFDFSTKNSLGKTVCLTKSKSGFRTYKNRTVVFRPASVICFDWGKILNSSQFKESLIRHAARKGETPI